MLKRFWFLIILLILFRFLWSRENFADGQILQITTRVASEPYRSGTNQSFRIKGLWVTLPSFPEIVYGDTVTVRGVVSGDKLADPKLISTTPSKNVLWFFRTSVLAFYRRHLPEPHAGLVGGIVLGAKSDLPPDFKAMLKTTGTSHVVVASGMNVTLVAGFLLSALLLIMPRRKAVAYSLAGIWVYAIMAGFDAPIIRASIMGSIAYLAQGMGRISFAWRTFFVAAAGMLLLRPDWILDLGFLLSFAATASLMLFGKRVGAWIDKLGLAKYVPSVFINDLKTTLAAQIGVAPILFVTFGQFNPVSPLINALVLWTVPLITIIGGLAALVGLVFEPAGRLLLYLTYPLTAYFVWVVGFFSQPIS